MTTMQGAGQHIPQWDFNDRLNKSLKSAGISVAEAAAYFEVHRNTVSGWLHGRINPDTRTVKLWAFMTGVPYEWLRDGIEPPAGPDDDGGAAVHPSDGREDMRGPSSNQPTDWDRTGRSRLAA